MIEIFHLAAELQDFCRQQHWPLCFIGGIAVQRWGEPRVTQDVDMTIWTGFGDEPRFVDGLLRRFAPTNFRCGRIRLAASRAPPAV